MNCEFANSAALLAHYAAVRRRLNSGVTPPQTPPPRHYSGSAERAVRAMRCEPEPLPPPKVNAVPAKYETTEIVVACGGATITIPGDRLPLTRVESIIRATCHVFGASRIDLVSKRRIAEIVRPRHVVMYLAREMTGESLPKIGRRLGGRDHTTILHGARKITGLIPSDPDLAEQVDAVRRLAEAIDSARPSEAVAA